MLDFSLFFNPLRTGSEGNSRKLQVKNIMKKYSFKRFSIIFVLLLFTTEFSLATEDEEGTKKRPVTINLTIQPLSFVTDEEALAATFAGGDYAEPSPSSFTGGSSKAEGAGARELESNEGIKISSDAKESVEPVEYEDESDSEVGVVDSTPFGKLSIMEISPVFSPAIVMAVRIKLLANVYLRNIDEKANIFLPFFRILGKGVDGKERESGNYFRYKGKICVFASGGFHNAWEKSVQSVYKAFYGTEIKIIRGSWIQKHLKEEVGFQNSEELHSELYYKTQCASFKGLKIQESL